MENGILKKMESRMSSLIVEEEDSAKPRNLTRMRSGLNKENFMKNISKLPTMAKQNKTIFFEKDH